MAEARIRRASMDDAEIIAQLHVDAWRESYASLMPPEALSLLSVEEQAERWRDIFRSHQGDDASAVFLAYDEGGHALWFRRLRSSAQSAPRGGGFSGRVFDALFVAAGAATRGSGAR